MKKNYAIFLSFCLALLMPIIGYAQAPEGYYKNAEGKNQKDLLVALRAIVGPHTAVSYDGLWTVYKTSDVRADGKVWDMYSTASFTPGQKQCGNYSKVGDCYNREHSFPKSWFNDATPMYSDAYHIYPTDGKVNGQRSNFPYGECENGTTLPSNGSIQALGKLGTSTFPGYSGTVFEPIDEYKGDFARSYFYMAAAYQDKIANWSSDMLARNDFPCFSSWAINLLLKWSREDPVSQKEVNRNNAVSGYQKNRNPFIDYPELAEYIWGNKTSEGWVPGGIPSPAITAPVVGQVINMGVSTFTKPIAYTMSVKGEHLTKNLNVTSSNSAFAISPATLDYNAVISGTATFTVTYTPVVEGEQASTITISSDEANVTCTVKGTAYKGIPALAATNVGTDSFTANWLYVSSDENYTLTVKDNAGNALHGYPLSVPAAAGNYQVTNLDASSNYTYSITNGTLTSNTVSVRTADILPVLSIIYPETGINLSTLPGTASEPMQVEIYSENITENITATVTGPFEISFDKATWSKTLTVNPDGEYIYIRSEVVSTEGTYTGQISVATSNISGIDADLKVVVAAPRTFLEDFESVADGGYYTKEVQGTACKWDFKDVGSWASDKNKIGTRSVRFGKTSTSSITMVEDKPNGASTLSFSAAIWTNDPAATLKISYSTDGGNQWIDSNNDVTITQALMTPYSVPLNVKGLVRVKIEQTAGSRLNLDDVAISDNTTSVEGVAKDNWDVYSVTGGIKVEAETGCNIMIYTTDAAKVYEGTTLNNNQFIPLEKGIYIVTLDANRGKKIIVR